ncbi:esterase-like activity of phytase family protein [Aestuariivirga sp.]|uniref:esterase-like activity of phytase family protein n=1 Tax=Aestuariivirga sp. TaxID=2650926 RepID=UPI0039E5D14D
MRRIMLPFAFALMASAAFADPVVTVTKIGVPDLPLGTAAYPGGKTLTLNLGIGSGAWRDPKDPPGVIWTITDRGPNIDCSEIEDVAGVTLDKACGGDKTAKNFPLPDFTPTITKLEIGADNKARVLETLPLKGKSGKPVTGLPFSSGALALEAAYDANGKPIAGNPSGLDTETLARLPDGSFIAGEEYGSSLVEIAADGTVTKRIVPVGLEGELKDADYQVTPGLPAIIAKRMLNRGIENVALSPDAAYLYVLMQSPLANPDIDAYKKSANTRLWKIERATGKVLGEYLYEEDKPDTFRTDNKKEAQKQNAVRMSEMVAVGPDRLLVLERISKSTKFYLVDLQSGTPVDAVYDDKTTSPSFEQTSLADLEAKGLKPLAKTLVLDSDDTEGLPKKIEGVAVLSPTEMIVLADSDFGIEGDTTEIRRITFSEPVLK